MIYLISISVFAISVKSRKDLSHEKAFCTKASCFILSQIWQNQLRSSNPPLSRGLQRLLDLFPDGLHGDSGLKTRFDYTCFFHSVNRNFYIPKGDTLLQSVPFDTLSGLANFRNRISSCSSGCCSGCSDCSSGCCSDYCSGCSCSSGCCQKCCCCTCYCRSSGYCWT